MPTSAPHGLTLPTTWVSTTADQIKEGMRIKVVEDYGDGNTCTYEGTVDSIGANVFQLPSGTAYRPDFEGAEGVKVKLYREPKKLPMAAGSAIKVYDPHLLRERVAVREVRPGAQTTRETGWYFVDEAPEGFRATQNEREMPEHLTEHAEILFDAGAQ